MKLLIGVLLSLGFGFGTLTSEAATDSPRLQKLGESLFFDVRLSGTNQMSCASCHDPKLGWSDGRPQAVGVHGKVLERRTPTLLEMALGESFFWDGRARTLEEQALGPITSPDEMDQDPDSLVGELGQVADYRRSFEEVFPGQGIQIPTIAEALAAFERTITHKQTPYERWFKGDRSALSESAQRGMRTFMSARGGCIQCHSGKGFSDGRFWDIGIRGEDQGRGRLFPEDPSVDHAFKTPTLWNIARRAPYMHNGSEATLREVIENYDIGGRVKRPSLSGFMRPLGLSEQEKVDLVEFLKALSED